MSKPVFDVVVFGATSFVGQILCSYLALRYGNHAKSELSWAAAGRSDSKLRALRDSLGPSASKLTLIQADSNDEAALRALCAQARVVVTTVGPYALYGETLVKVCAETGTDYCDLTGETPWIKRMIETYEATAKKSGARIVHCCGFDSIPSDLGVWFLQQQAKQKFGKPCSQIKMRVKAMRGSASGGTVASLMNVVREAVSDPALRKMLANPYALCPPSYAQTVRQPSVKGAVYDHDFDAWSAPFVMAAINTRIVFRSNALLAQAYGKAFTYEEAMLTGRGLPGRMAALGLTAGLGGFTVAAALPPSRWFLQKFVVPAPGEGPSPQAQEKGFYDLRFLGTTDDGKQVRIKVTGDRDPGYGSTGKMLGQAAACLAQDISKTRKAGGFWTPASIFGDKLIDRLQAHAGLQFEVI
jgi:short subunit dehydrogenase-like uncharacterized protein